jgi:hypothetical protein
MPNISECDVVSLYGKRKFEHRHAQGKTPCEDNIRVIFSVSQQTPKTAKKATRSKGRAREVFFLSPEKKLAL